MKTMKKILLPGVVFVTVFGLLAGCATVPPVPTKTSKPDVTIQASKAAVFDAVTDELLNEGYMLKSANEAKDIIVYFIHYPKMEVIWETLPVDERVTVNLVQTSTGIRVLGDTSYIAYPGTNRERAVAGSGFSTGPSNVNRNNHKIYALFLRVQQRLENK